MPSNEMFVSGSNPKTDAPLHNEILDNPEADAKLAKAAPKLAAKLGLTERQIAALFPPM